MNFKMKKLKELERIKKRIILLERTLSQRKKKESRKLIIKIIVDLEKLCHRKDTQFHYVLGESREICKRWKNKIK